MIKKENEQIFLRSVCNCIVDKNKPMSSISNISEKTVVLKQIREFKYTEKKKKLNQHYGRQVKTVISTLILNFSQNFHS